MLPVIGRKRRGDGTGRMMMMIAARGLWKEEPEPIGRKSSLRWRFC